MYMYMYVYIYRINSYITLFILLLLLIIKAHILIGTICVDHVLIHAVYPCAVCYLYCCMIIQFYRYSYTYRLYYTYTSIM